ncbi:hypothetical protein F1559_001200 [Cyanidiococcus yangmingshanensis]|uniref:Uncharacterized protein n=1 Tax=Cyanidiococcus yangmingshanensis TaxID=2690220 RepID=A0A7J7IPT3_9RHOD|nr:hypothetical protein F1559_001200 [Cyanidiococcus yangmingshanensis]
MDTGVANTLSKFGAVEAATEGGISAEVNMPSGPWRLGRRHVPRAGGKTNLEDASSSTTLASVALAELEADNLRLELEERDEWLSRVHKQLEESQRELESYRAEAGRLRQIILDQKGRLRECDEKQQALVQQLHRIHVKSIAQEAVDCCIYRAIWKGRRPPDTARNASSTVPQLHQRWSTQLLHEQRCARKIRNNLRSIAQMQRTFMAAWHDNVSSLATAVPQLAALVPSSMLRDLEETQRNALRVEFAHLEQTLRAREKTLNEREARVADLETEKERVAKRERELTVWETRLGTIQQGLEEQRHRMERLMEGMIPVEIVEARERNLRHRESAMVEYERSVEKALQQRKEALQAEQAELELHLRDEWTRFHHQCDAERRDLQKELDHERMRFREKIEVDRLHLLITI